MSLLFLFACITGRNYPEKNAEIFCETMYQCIEEDTIEDFLQYDDEEDCVTAVIEQIISSKEYQEWEADTAEFKKEKAEACLAEIVEVQSEQECDGTMNPLSFSVDVYVDDCFEVYTAPQ